MNAEKKAAFRMVPRIGGLSVALEYEVYMTAPGEDRERFLGAHNSIPAAEAQIAQAAVGNRTYAADGTRLS